MLIRIHFYRFKLRLFLSDSQPRAKGWRFFEEIIRFKTQWYRIPTVHQIRSKCYSIQLSNLCLPEMRPPHPGLFAGPCCLAGVES